MSIEVIKTTSHSHLCGIRDLFRNVSNMLTRDESSKRLLSNDIKDLYHLIEQYRSHWFKPEVLLAYTISLIAQVDLKKAELLIRQLPSLYYAGLFGLLIRDIPLEFRHMSKLHICCCDVEYLAIHCSIFSDFAVDVDLHNSCINTLVIYFNVLCMLEKPQIERHVLEYLEENRVTVENLQIKFS